MDSFIETHAEIMIEDLIRLLQQPSISTTGEGIRTCAELVRDLMQEVGVEAVIHETAGHPVVVGRIEGNSDQTLLVYGHYDVQPPDPLDEWDHDPFGGERVGNKIYARGAIDDKGNFLAALQAVRYYTQNNGKPPVNLVFVIEGEEEISSPNLSEFLRNHQDDFQADALVDLDDCVQPDGRPKVVTGVKGICYIEITARAKRDYHSLMAPLLQNPVWRLIWALSTFKNQQEEILIDGFYDDVRHPTPAELRALERLNYDGREWLTEAGQEGFVGERNSKDAMHAFFFLPTCNICGIQGGYTGEGSKTIIPGKATAKIDFRLVPDQDPKQVLKATRQHLDAHGFSDLEVRMLGATRWYRNSPEVPVALALRNAVDEVFEEGAAVWVTYAGSGPSSLFDEALGIPQVNSGFGPVGDRIHAPNEYMTTDLYLKAIQVMILMYKNFADLSQ